MVKEGYNDDLKSKYASWDSDRGNKYIIEAGSQPLAMRTYSTSDSERGTYKYIIEARASLVNATIVYFNLTVEIEITPCITVNVTAPQIFQQSIVYYEQP